MKELIVKTGEIVLVDDTDYEALSQYVWHVYRRNGYQYPVAQIAGRRTYMHRLLVGVPGLVVDHINGNTLDNRRENLRSVSHAINCQNRTAAPLSNTGYRHVYRLKNGTIIARVVRNGARHYLGAFRTADQANAAVAAFLASGGDLKELSQVIGRQSAEIESLKKLLAAMLREAA